MLVSPTILAVAFLAPAFAAAGVLLASLPILIHILNRRRFRTVDWAAMDFLLRAMRKNRKRLRFESWLLLLTRCLVLALLGLALARPVSCSDTSLAGIGQKTGLHVFVIDNSYSMAYEDDRGEDHTHFEHAKRLVEKMIDGLSAGGESVAIITAAQPATAIIAKPDYDLQEVHAIVNRIPQSFGSTDLLGALRLAKEIGQDNAKQTDRNLYLFTDATRSAWQTPAAAAIKNIAADLAPIYHITHFNLSNGKQWNQAVLDVHPAGNLVTTKNNFGSDFVAVAKGFGDGPDAMLQWKLDGNLLPGAVGVHLSGDTPPQTQSQALIRTGGPHVISASLIGDDRLKIDNARYHVVNVAADLKVLIVEGQRGVGPLGGSGAFLQLALAPPKENGGAVQTDSYVSPELISDLELGNRVLSDYRAVILCGVGDIQAAQADRMQKFVTGGGTLMLFMGEPVSGDNYNKVLLPRGLMPGPLTKRMNASAGEKGFEFDLNPNGVLHPLLKAFANLEKTGLDTAQIFTYWQADVPNDPALRVLNYRSQQAVADPAITVHTLGQGHVVFISTTANADWTTLPAKPAYVALMHELLAGSINAGEGWMNLTVGESLNVPATVKLTAMPTLTDPTGVVLTMQQAMTGSGLPLFSSEPLRLPGVYTLTTGLGNVPIAVNVPAEEADVRTIDNTAIKAAMGNVDMTLTDDQPPPTAGLANNTSDLGWNVMLLVLGFVGLEAVLAMRFGHHKRN